jgi:hypothetical protein
MSMNPGATIFPEASRTVRASAVERGPRARIRSPEIPRSAWKGLVFRPSTTVPFLMTMS